MTFSTKDYIAICDTQYDPVLSSNVKLTCHNRDQNPLIIIIILILIAHNVTLRFPHCEEAFAQRVHRAARVSTGTLQRSTCKKNIRAALCPKQELDCSSFKIFGESIVEIGAVLSGSWPAVVWQFIMIARGNHSNGVTFVISIEKLRVYIYVYLKAVHP